MDPRKSSWLTIAALFCAFLLAGCDDYVQITRDPDIRIPKLATWAWRAAPEPAKAGDARPVVSRDVISRRETVERDTHADNEMARERVKTAIEKTLASKGLHQISDPEAADFLVDYNFAVKRRNARVPVAYGVRSGHVSTGNITLPFGVQARLSVRNAKVGLRILESAVDV